MVLQLLPLYHGAAAGGADDDDDDEGEDDENEDEGEADTRGGGGAQVGGVVGAAGGEGVSQVRKGHAPRKLVCVPLHIDGSLPDFLVRPEVYDDAMVHTWRAGDHFRLRSGGKVRQSGGGVTCCFLHGCVHVTRACDAAAMHSLRFQDSTCSCAPQCFDSTQLVECDFAPVAELTGIHKHSMRTCTSGGAAAIAGVDVAAWKRVSSSLFKRLKPTVTECFDAWLHAVGQVPEIMYVPPPDHSV
jgi:hypothetical protein